MTDPAIARLRAWLLALAGVVVFLGVVVPIGVIWVQTANLSANELKVTCEIRRQQVETHKQLEDLRLRLGLPPGPMTEGLPVECMEL